MKLRVWCDSGANAKSRREELFEINVSQLGYSFEEWSKMSDKEKEEVAKELAFAALDWGFEEVEE